ncbi:MAG: hypothetical protein LBR22_02210 [Desulfovibrio sp.]|nr:hypothetical protein [Desulfovibrio sp.]
MTTHPPASPADYFHKRLLLVDCAAGTCRTEILPDGALRDGLAEPGGLGATLARRHGGLCLAAGPLTGGFAPASGGLGIFGEDGPAAHVPLGHGTALRLCGFDAAVLVGRAKEPSILRCRYNSATLGTCAPRIDGHTLRTSLLAETENGIANILLAVSPRGADACAAAGLEHGPASQGRLMARLMGRHGIVAIVLEAEGVLPRIPVPLKNPLQEAVAAGIGAPSLDGWIRETFQEGHTPPPDLHGKPAACHHCPSPCLAWLKGDDGWILCADHEGAAAAFEKCGAEAPILLARCFRLGLDAALCAPLVPEKVPLESVLTDLATKATPPPAPGGLDLADQTVAMGLALGLCPRFLRRNPRISPDLAASLLAPDMAEIFLSSHGSKEGAS